MNFPSLGFFSEWRQRQPWLWVCVCVWIACCCVSNVLYLNKSRSSHFSSTCSKEMTIVSLLSLFFYYFAKKKTISIHSIFYNLFFSGEWNKIKKHQHTRTNRQRSALVGSLREIYAGMMMRGEQRVEGLHQVPPLPGGRHSRSRASLFLSLSHILPTLVTHSRGEDKGGVWHRCNTTPLLYTLLSFRLLLLLLLLLLLILCPLDHDNDHHLDINSRTKIVAS